MAAMEPWAIPLAALIISIAAIAFAWFTLKQTANTSYVEQLERRIEHLERELTASKAAEAAALALVSQTRDENIDLLRKLMAATGGRRELPQ